MMEKQHTFSGSNVTFLMSREQYAFRVCMVCATNRPLLHAPQLTLHRIQTCCFFPVPGRHRVIKGGEDLIEDYTEITDVQSSQMKQIQTNVPTETISIHDTINRVYDQPRTNNAVEHELYLESAVPIVHEPAVHELYSGSIAQIVCEWPSPTDGKDEKDSLVREVTEYNRSTAEADLFLASSDHVVEHDCRAPKIGRASCRERV